MQWGLIRERSGWSQVQLIKCLKKEYFNQTSNTCYPCTDLNRLEVSYGFSEVRLRSLLCLIVVRGWWGRLRFCVCAADWSDWPAGPGPLDPSCGWVDRLRFCWRRFPPVERALRICTSLTLKNATMKGCFSSAPSRPTRPASLELMLCPVLKDTALKICSGQDLPQWACWFAHVA